jgi:hypothetical protein
MWELRNCQWIYLDWVLILGESILQRSENRAATGRERYHERRTSTTLSALPAGRGSVTPSNGSTFMSHTQ